MRARLGGSRRGPWTRIPIRSDIADPCAQPPFGDNLRPIFFLHDDRDVAGICQTGGESFAAKLAETMPGLLARSAILDPLQVETSRCDTLCAYDGDPAQLLTPGALRHSTWPHLWNDRMFALLRDHARS